MNTRIQRKHLRSAIVRRFPNLSSKGIYDCVKKGDRAAIFFDDLYEICESAGIGRAALPEIFRTYGVAQGRIRREQFVMFLDDEVTVKEFLIDIPKALTDEQISILSRFCRALKSRRTQAIFHSPNAAGSEGISMSQLWIHLCRLSPTRAKVTHLRVAALCQMASDLNMFFSAEDLIDALFTFFDEACEALDFEQFTRLMETF